MLSCRTAESQDLRGHLRGTWLYCPFRTASICVIGIAARCSSCLRRRCKGQSVSAMTCTSPGPAMQRKVDQVTTDLRACSMTACCLKVQIVHCNLSTIRLIRLTMMIRLNTLQLTTVAGHLLFACLHSLYYNVADSQSTMCCIADIIMCYADIVWKTMSRNWKHRLYQTDVT